ncbi:MAG: endonuclease III [Thermodesulfobacteriota bacterium]|nr:endonuclease III [Thermodesulfobacteriota bacterium]
MGSKQVDIKPFISELKKLKKTSRAPVITLIANRGADPYNILVSTLLSLRTKDEVTYKASERLLKKAGTPEKMVALTDKTIEKLIYPVGFYHTKAKRLKEVSRILLDQYGGKVPDTLDALLALPGVGRKTANLVLIEGFGKAAICVDTHVHRVSNRIGLVTTKTPEQTEFALQKTLPKAHWKTYNELLVMFGQTICVPISPFCSQCPVQAQCPAIGVTRRR